MDFNMLQEAFPYENAVLLLWFAGVLVCGYIISNFLIFIDKKIHCHRIMKKGKLHKCHYWTCEYYYVCPYNSVDFKTPKRFLDSVKE